jgi:hypothetical protein
MRQLWSSRDHGAVRQLFQRQRWRRRARPADSAGLASPRKTDPRKRRPWAVKPEPKPRKGTPHERVAKTHSTVTVGDPRAHLIEVLDKRLDGVTIEQLAAEQGQPLPIPPAAPRRFSRPA